MYDQNLVGQFSSRHCTPRRWRIDDLQRGRRIGMGGRRHRRERQRLVQEEGENPRHDVDSAGSRGPIDILRDGFQVSYMRNLQYGR